MEFLQYWFRTTPDQGFPLFRPVHFLWMLLGISILFAFGRMGKDTWKKIRPLFILLIIYDLTHRYGFYFFTGYSGIKESLPLYHCRIALILGLIYCFKRSKPLGTMIFYWGFLGGIANLIYPQPDAFAWPHVMLFLFFVSHSLLLALSMIIYRNGDVWWPLGKVRLVTLVYNIFLVAVNHTLGANYGFMSKPPFGAELFAPFPPIVYSLCAILFFDLLMIFVHRILLFALRESEKKEILEPGRKE